MRIAHFSDIHVEAGASEVAWRHLLGRRTAGFVNLHFGPRKRHFVGATDRLVRTLEEVVATEPDLIVLSGDLTALGLEQEFARAREVLQPFLTHADWLVIPGNHDVYTLPDARRELYRQYFGDLYRADITAEGRTTPYVRLIGGDLAFVVCETARANRAFWDSRGEVSPEELAALETLLRHDTLSHRQVFLVTHYAPYMPSGKPDSGWHGLRDLDHVLAALRPHMPALWLHGHIHHSYALVDGETEFKVADAGSGTHDPRQSFNLYEGSPEAGWTLTGHQVSERGCEALWEKRLAVHSHADAVVPPDRPAPRTSPPGTDSARHS